MIVAKKTHQGCVLEEKKTGLLALLISVQQMFYFIIHLFVVWNVKWRNYYIVISVAQIFTEISASAIHRATAAATAEVTKMLILQFY